MWPSHKKRGTKLREPLWILEATYSLFGCVIPTHLLSNPESCFEGGPGQEKALQQVQVAMQASLQFRPHVPEDPLVLEGSMVDRDAFWSLWQVPVGEQHCNPS